MKPIGLGLAVAALAATLFAAGALSPLAPGASPPRGVAPHTTAPLLAPVAARGTLDATIASLQERVRESGPDPESLASLGLAYLQQARLTADPSYYPKAEAALHRSLRLDESENFPALLGMGVLAAARHDFKRALEWGRQARSLNPYNADARGLIGDALIELGRYGSAERSLQAMVNLRPDVSSYARVSYFRELHGDTRGAIQAMKLADDASLGATADGAWVAFQLGELYFNSGRLKEAKRAYARGAWLASDYAPPRAGLAKVADAHGNWRRATALLEGVAATFPSPEYVILLGDLYAREGRAEKSLAQYDLARAIASPHERSGVNTDVEMTLFAVDQGIDPMIEPCALSGKPCDKPRKVGGLTRWGRAERTVARARSAFERRPSIHAADALAWALYAQGDYRTARRFSQKALRLGTHNALFSFHRGMIERGLGDRNAAARYLTAALRTNPHFSFRYGPIARTALARLSEAKPR
jgi:tetratricopeptide (TPR) repeat protein